MDIVMTNADVKLTQIASCIGRFPKSWANWMAMRITFDSSSDDTLRDVHHAAKSIIGSYLVGIEVRVYYCSNTLHIICKNTSYEILDQTGKQVCNLLSDESDDPVVYEVYDLSQHAEDYARLADQDSNSIFLHSSTARFLDRHKLNQFESQNIGRQRDLKNMARVLLVEDDPVTRWMVRNSLKNQCEFATASCANKAFSMYSAFNPEIVFLDINLPDNNGYNVLQWIMRNDPGACVVMFSSQSNLDNILEAIEKGASGFIAKPFLQENLLGYVRGLSVRQ